MAVSRSRAVLFADLVGSTRLYEALGDREAHAITAGCLAGLREAVERFDGIIIKTIGDGVMATFLTADAAFHCAGAIVAGMRCAALGNDRPLGVHIGFHYGPVIEANGDVFGDTVNVAARLMELAENQRIFTTGATTDQLDASLRARLLRVGRVAVRGRRDRVEIFELTTGNETLTHWVDVPSEHEPTAVAGWLKIFCDGREHALRGDGGPITIGRDASNDLVLKSPQASRFHAKLERRKRGWYLVDRSSNGTVVEPDGGRATWLRREDRRIEGSGTLRVGGVPSTRRDEPIRYELRDPETA
jgi:class 3 adenylate cyclase